MQDVNGQVNLIVRQFGITRVGSKGKAILVNMAIVRIQNPEISYEEILEKLGPSRIDNKVNRESLFCNTEELSDLECCVLAVIEELEAHENYENGRNVIKSWIMKIYDEYQQNLSYERVNKEVIKFGFEKRKKGTDLLISIVYKRYIDESTTKEELESYMIKQIALETIEEWEKENPSIPVEIVNGVENHKAVLAKDEMIIEKIKSLIMEAAKDSLECSKLSSVEEIVQAILNHINHI